ncbi:MAG: thiopurine S-methyltransferase [Euryarchaeota archaeon]
MTIWHERWSANQIGFHRAVPHDLLTKHWAAIGSAPDAHVLVPLCGKSLDMHWLVEQGHSVTGVELVREAAQAFFQEMNVTPLVESNGPINRYAFSKNVILQGDLFTVAPSMASCDAWYDRAALVALPSSMRPEYVDQIHSLCTPGAVGLMITFAYPQEQMQGPPFSLPDDEVLSLFESRFDVELLDKIDLEDEKQRGLSTLTSSVYKLTRR